MSGDELWREARELIAARTTGRAGFFRALWGYSPAEGFPRFHLDRYGDWWLAIFHAPEIDSPGLRALVDLLASTGAGVAVKFRNDDRKSTAAGRVLAGDPRAAEALVVEQPGYRFEAHLTSDLDAGAYPDAEELRQELLRNASGKRFLNVFAYTCLFGVAALRGGARSTINVDVSRHCLRWGMRNYELNGLRVDGRDFVAEDALRFLRRAGRAGERWDALIVDPPPFFSTGKLRRASDDTIDELLAGALGVAGPGARIHFLQCTARLTAEELAARVEKGLAALGRRGRVTARAWSGPAPSPRELAPTFKEARIDLVQLDENNDP